MSSQMLMGTQGWVGYTPIVARFAWIGDLIDVLQSQYRYIKEIASTYKLRLHQSLLNVSGAIALVFLPRHAYWADFNWPRHVWGCWCFTFRRAFQVVILDNFSADGPIWLIRRTGERWSWAALGCERPAELWQSWVSCGGAYGVPWPSVKLCRGCARTCHLMVWAWMQSFNRFCWVIVPQRMWRCFGYGSNPDPDRISDRWIESCLHEEWSYAWSANCVWGIILVSSI